MLVLACVLLAAVVVRLTGGRLVRLAELRWRGRWLLLATLAVQVVVIEAPELFAGLAEAVHVLTYAAAGGFVWLNRHLRGLWLVALGAAANGVTIALNGGTLPSTPEAMATAGIEPGEGFVNSGLVADPVLPWLGDVFAVPAWLPFANVFSVGDVLIVAGAAWLLHAGARGGAASPSRSAPAGQPAAA